MSVVTFDIDEFRMIYPSFEDATKFTDTMLKGCFNRAEMYVNNTSCSVINNVTTRKIMLYMLTAHITTLTIQSTNGDWYAGVISSATEGSTSIGLVTPNVTKRNAWYMKTPFGQEYWEMTAKYRTFQYTHSNSRPSWEGTNGRWWNLRETSQGL